MKIAALVLLFPLVFQAQRPLTPREALLEQAEFGPARDLVSRFLASVQDGGELAKDGTCVALVARALFDAGREAEAFELLDRAPRNVEARARVDITWARLKLECDLQSEAEARLGGSSDHGRLPTHENDPEFFIVRAKIRARFGSLEQAAEDAERFLARAPQDVEAPSAWQIRAEAASERGDAEGARAFLARVESTRRWHELFRARRLQIHRDPTAPLPRLGLGLLWMEVGEHARAREIYAELVGVAPDFARGHFHLGEAERLLGHAEAALAAYDRALELEPSYALALHQRGALQRAAGRNAEARTDFERLLALPDEADPKYLSAHLTLARILMDLGAPEAAAKRYARYLELGGKETLRP
jgi:tetratricopeptide (TPR) repeat protein